MDTGRTTLRAVKSSGSNQENVIAEDICDFERFTSVLHSVSGNITSHSAPEAEVRAPDHGDNARQFEAALSTERGRERPALHVDTEMASQLPGSAESSPGVEIMRVESLADEKMGWSRFSHDPESTHAEFRDMPLKGGFQRALYLSLGAEPDGRPTQAEVMGARHAQEDGPQRLHKARVPTALADAIRANAVPQKDAKKARQKKADERGKPLRLTSPVSQTGDAGYTTSFAVAGAEIRSEDFRIKKGSYSSTILPNHSHPTSKE